MRLKDLLYKVNILKLVGSTNITISNIQFDSRKITKNSLFIAVEGSDSDGHNFIQNAIIDGATAIIVNKMPNQTKEHITYVQVDSSNKALALIAANFYDHPSEKLKLVGVTGTNGKTTIVNLLYQLFSLLKIKVGMLSTIENRINNNIITSTHTTPDPLQINFLLNKMVQDGCEYCFIEVSSHSLNQARVYGLNFNGGVFTNLSNDHLDYHKTFSEYRDAKKSFFDILNKEAFALVNKDDKNSLKMLEGTVAKKLTYSLKSFSTHTCKVLENRFEGMLLQINKVDVFVKLIGEFNAYNILAVYGVAKQLGIDDFELLTALSMLESPEGRFQFFRNKNGITGIVDYAHTDDALKNILTAINTIRSNSESLITVFGCGGDRYKSKRPIMARIACNLSTQVILTSDNPRTENPNDIINEMIAGLDTLQKKKVLAISDRRQAILAATKIANKNDVILVAGKGHEKYQEIKASKVPFDDMKELKQSLNIIF